MIESCLYAKYTVSVIVHFRCVYFERCLIVTLRKWYKCMRLNLRVKVQRIVLFFLNYYRGYFLRNRAEYNANLMCFAILQSTQLLHFHLQVHSATFIRDEEMLSLSKNLALVLPRKSEPNIPFESRTEVVYLVQEMVQRYHCSARLSKDCPGTLGMSLHRSFRVCFLFCGSIMESSH